MGGRASFSVLRVLITLGPTHSDLQFAEGVARCQKAPQDFVLLRKIGMPVTLHVRASLRQELASLERLVRQIPHDARSACDL